MHGSVSDEKKTKLHTNKMIVADSIDSAARLLRRDDRQHDTAATTKNDDASTGCGQKNFKKYTPKIIFSATALNIKAKFTEIFNHTMCA